MNYYKATIQYDGTNFCGFQWQKGLSTVQNEINQAVSKLVEGKVSTVGASRTDTGVHALEQIVKITSQHEIDCESFTHLFNQALPAEVRCLKLEPCAGSFNPMAFSSSKEYRYLFTNVEGGNGGEQRFLANVPYRLNIPLMEEGARKVIGLHDFRNFCSTGSNVKTTIRTIFDCKLTEIDPHSVLSDSHLFPLPLNLKNCYQLKIEGEGFLKQMVRHLMGALWLVGREKISLYEFEILLKGEEQSRQRWRVATPRGLFLYRFKF